MKNTVRLLIAAACLPLQIAITTNSYGQAQSAATGGGSSDNRYNTYYAPSETQSAGNSVGSSTSGTSSSSSHGWNLMDGPANSSEYNHSSGVQTSTPTGGLGPQRNVNCGSPYIDSKTLRKDY